MADPLSSDRLRSILLRVGVPLVAIWVIGAVVFSYARSAWTRGFSLGLPVVLTLAAIGFFVWLMRQASKARGVAGILSGVETKDQREAALAQLDSKFKAGDTTATFARAQLRLQDDPRAALQVLEKIDLGKVMANVADEARGQRAMIHLMLGEVTPARDLADGVQLSRHQDVRSRAMLTAVVAEAWARSGQAKRAVDTLSLVDPADEELVQLRPQLFRARAFAFAHAGDLKQARQALRRLMDQDPRILGGFVGGKTHPLLQKEAKKMLAQSGVIPRKMQVQRRL